MNDRIDFVLTWVDGSDEEWLKEKKKYLQQESNIFLKDGGEERYRDWDTLKYWFRGVEKFASWVNKIYFVTWGHVPQWLNVDNHQIEVVRHKDFIPHEYLPTFNINTIENNFHRIQGLSENFVYFNDDLFLIRPTDEETFFKNNLPVDAAILTAHCYSRKETLVMTPIMDIGVINAHFDIKRVLRDNFFKWFCIRYRKGLLQNIVLSGCPRFPGIFQPHLATAFKKSTYEEVWDNEYELLDWTCKNKFRSTTDVNQWLFREWQLAKGEFVPRNKTIGKSYVINKDNRKDIFDYMLHAKGNMVCINDAAMLHEEFIELQTELISIFEKILPEKSKYEK